MKLVTVIGTRPEIIRLSCIIRKADEHFDHILVHTGQNYDVNLNEVFFNEMNIRKPDYCLNVVGKNLGETMGNVISKSYDLFVELKPEAILILGDTNSALSAISAKRLKIPIFHMEAGNRCFDMNVPEEINRRIVDVISDVNLPYTEHSRRYLLNEGFSGDRIFVTGSPMTEVIKYYENSINSTPIKEQPYIVASVHREENLDLSGCIEKVVDILNTVAEKYNVSIYLSTHPRTKKKLEEKKLTFNDKIIVSEPFSFFTYLNLQKNAMIVISDSGTITEEAAILGFKAISLRSSTERPEGLDNGVVITTSLDKDRVLESIDITLKTSTPNVPLDYQVTDVSTKVIKLIQSYTPIINKKVWYKF